MPRLSSTAVDRVEYAADTRTLDIWYKGGDKYRYFGVPAPAYQALLAAPSAGAFVNTEIKPHYRYELESRRRRFRPSEE